MTHLITAAEIKASTVAQGSIDTQKLETYVPLAEGKHLRAVLGNGLYSELLLDAQTPPLTGALLALAAQCTDMLCWWTLVEAWPHLLVHVTNAGVLVKTGRDQGTSSADARLTDAALGAHRETALFYTAELRRWLQEHAADYPSYVAATSAPRSSMPLGGVQF